MSSFNLVEGLRIFRTVVDAGSITQGARRLGLSVTWTAKNIERLEAHLSATLLQRTTRRLRLTEAGSSCYELSGRLINDVVELEELIGLSAVAPKGLIRISAPVSFAVCEFGPVLAAFRKIYPDVQLDVSLSDRFVDVVEEGFDLALRVTHALPDSGLLARKLAPIRRIACATPTYLKLSGTPKHPVELQSHHCLVFSLLWQRNTWPFLEDGKPLEIHPPTTFTTNNSLLIREALVASAGIALIPEPIVREDLLKGAVVPILSQFEAEPLSLFLVRPADRRLPRRVSVFIDFLVANLPTTRHEALANAAGR
jgi:DNA-binding transcriptional LysR family regulator